MDSTNKKEIEIKGKKHKVETIDGKHYIDGKTIDEFVDTLDALTLRDFIQVGLQKIKDMKTGAKQCSYQQMLKDKHSVRNN